MKKHIFLFFFLFSLNSKVLELDKMEDMLSYVDSNTMVLFDIDEVVIAPHVTWLWEEEFLKHHMQWNDVDLESQEISYFLYKLRFPLLYQFVDHKFKSIIKKIREKGGLVGGLTARADADPYLWTFFAKEGIFFELPYANTKSGKVVLKEGIIFCSYRHKGKSLFRIIPELKHKIIFIDDILENCYAVSSSCKKKGIECYSFHYKQAEHLFNLEMAEFQFKHWKNTGEILSDHDAREALQEK